MLSSLAAKSPAQQAAPRVVAAIAAFLLTWMLMPLPAQANAVEAYNLGLQYRRQKKFGEALRQFNLAIQQDPNYLEAYIQRIDFYCSINQEAKALADCNKAISLDPGAKKCPKLYFYRSLAYRQLEQPENSLTDSTKALSFGGPDIDGILDLQVYGYRNTGKIVEAIQAQTKRLEKYPPKKNLDRFYRVRAELYEAINKPNQAVADLNKAIAINPRFDTCYEQLARVHEHMGQPQKALEDFTALLKLNTNDDATYFERGHLYLKMGRYAEAVADLSKSIEIDPRLTSKAYDYRAQAYDKLGKPDLAAKDRASSAKLKE